LIELIELTELIRGGGRLEVGVNMSDVRRK
jgi:hypothetical protein